MLYNPKWSKPSLGGFITWLSQQDPDTEYVYENCDTCAIGRYLKSIGTSYSDQLWPPSGAMFGIIREWNMNITFPFPRTFGAALKRARKALA